MKKILLVDDDIDFLLLLQNMLRSKGYVVIALECGNNVISTMEVDHPDLLILDINIGEYDGREICRQVKSDHSYDHIPIILLSALVKENDAMNGCEEDAFIEKPISTSLFLQRIESLMIA